MITRLRGPLAALVIIAATAACGGGSGVSGTTLEFTITDKGCDPATATAQPGSTKFHVKNADANNITEFEVLDRGNSIVGEKENLTPGLEGEFTVDLKQGTYTIACPGGTEHATGTLTVGAAASGPAASGAAANAHHSDDESGACVPVASAGAASTTVKATLSDFKIDLAPTTVAAGTVQLDSTNTGIHPHEIVVVKGIPSNQLPTDANGAVDEDKLPKDAVVGEIEAFSPRRECSGAFQLTSGTYTLFCNVQGAEEGAHFRQGMTTTLTVS